MDKFRDYLECNQIAFYFAAVLAAIVSVLFIRGLDIPEWTMNPALALLLFVTFLQVPLAELAQAVTRIKFLGALLTTNFLAIPLVVAILVQLFPFDSMIKLGVLLVLLTPCVDYVVTFSHQGGADARLLLAATPVLLLVQIFLLPLYLRWFLGDSAADFLQLGPFIHAFVWLIAVPLTLAALFQGLAARSGTGRHIVTWLGLLPVPVTALVLFIIVAAVIHQVEAATEVALHVFPLYVVFSVVAPLLGWAISRLFRLDAPAGRAVAFSAGTRNSLVVLPLAMAIPGAIPVLPAIIVTQTLVELICELIYIRVIPKLGETRE